MIVLYASSSVVNFNVKLCKSEKSNLKFCLPSPIVYSSVCTGTKATEWLWCLCYQLKNTLFFGWWWFLSCDSSLWEQWMRGQISLTWLAVRASRVCSLSRTLCMSSCSLANATTICSLRLPPGVPVPPQWPPSPSPPLCMGTGAPELRPGDLEPDRHRDSSKIHFLEQWTIQIFMRLCCYIL